MGPILDTKGLIGDQRPRETYEDLRAPLNDFYGSKGTYRQLKGTFEGPKGALRFQ